MVAADAVDKAADKAEAVVAETEADAAAVEIPEAVTDQDDHQQNDLLTLSTNTKKLLGNEAEQLFLYLYCVQIRYAFQR